VIEIERLPHPLAVALRGHALEERPFVRAWRLCEAMEMLTRFLTATALAEIAAGMGEAGFPPALRRVMTSGLGRPTFGAWAAILRQARAALPPSDRMLAPELGRAIDDVLDAIGLPTDPVEAKVLSFRNALAHDWFPDDQVQQLLGEHGHEARFQTLWSGRVATLLGGLELLGRTEGDGWRILRGAPSDPGRFSSGSADRLVATPEQRAAWTPGVVLLTRVQSPRWLSLYPLQAFAPVLHRMDGRVEAAVAQPIGQIYSRATPLIQYTALHPRVGHGDASQLMQAAFDVLYPLAAWRDAFQQAAEARDADQALRQAVRPFRFRDVVEPLLTDPFLGRERDLAAVLAWLDANPSATGLVVAAPGMGKTALVAHLSVRLGQERKTWLCLRHFFKADDDRCSARQFMTGVLLQLRLAGGIATELPAPADQARRAFLDALAAFARDRLGAPGSSRRLIILVDGLDEIAQREPEFLGLVVARALPNVTWLCFGRAERAVLDALPDGAAPRVLGDEGLGPLDRRAVREYLLEELEARRAEFLQHESPSGASAFLDALTDGVRSLPLYQHLVVEDIRRGQFEFDRPDQLPASLAAYYDRLVRRLAMDAAHKVLPDVIALLAMAYTPLTGGMLSTLLADHDLRLEPDWERILGESLRLGHVLMARGYLWNEAVGYTLYHPSFRDHLRAGAGRAYDEFPMAPVLRAARRRLLNLCRRWAELAPGSDERRYAMSLAHWHLIEASDIAGLAALAARPAGPDRGGFLREIARTPGLSEGDALEAAARIAQALAEAGPAHWPDFLSCAEQYGEMADAGRRDPQALERMVAEDRLRDVVLTITAQPDLYFRGALMLATVPLLVRAGRRELAERLWQEGVSLVRAHLREGIDALEGHRPETEQLVESLYAALSTNEELVDLAARPAVASRQSPANPPRASIPWGDRILARVGSFYPGAYFFPNYAALMGSMLWLALVVSFVGGPGTSLKDVTGGWVPLILVAVLFAPPLVIPLTALPRRILSARARQLRALVASLAAGIEQAGSVDEQRRRLSRVLRFQRDLDSAVPALGLPRVLVASWVARRLELHTSLADAARVVLGASGDADDVGAAIAATLAAMDPTRLSQVFRAVLDRTLPGFDDVQVLRILIGTGDRLGDPAVLVEYLDHLSRMSKRQPPLDPRPLLAAADPCLLGRAILASLSPRPVQKLPRWNLRTAWSVLGTVVHRWSWGLLVVIGPDRLRSRSAGLIYVVLITPIALLLTVVFVLFGLPIAAAALLGGRVHDPFDLADAARGRTVAETRQWLSERLKEPAFSFSAVHAWFRGRRKVRKPEWLLTPTEVRRIRETILAQRIVRGESIELSSVPISSMRRVVSGLVKGAAGAFMAPLVLRFMGDRPLLLSIRGARPDGGVAARQLLEDPAADQRDLGRVLPLRSGRSLALSLLVALVVVACWLALVVWPWREAPPRWVWPYEAQALGWITLWLIVSQHLPRMLNVDRLLVRRWPRWTHVVWQRRIQTALGVIGLIVVVRAHSNAIDAAAGAGYPVPRDGPYFLIPLLPAFVTALVVPGLIARWRGAGLFYASPGELWRQRVASLGWMLGACVVLALVVHAVVARSPARLPARGTPGSSHQVPGGRRDAPPPSSLATPTNSLSTSACRSSSGASWRTIAPFWMSSTRWASSAMNSRFCSTSRIVSPCVRWSWRRTPMSSSMMDGWMPSVGSSKRMSLGWPARQRAIARSCCSPPLSAPPRRLSSGASRGNVATIVSMRSSAPRPAKPMRRLSRTLSPGKISRPWGT
jgi:hypothetical protein